MQGKWGGKAALFNECWNATASYIDVRYFQGDTEMVGDTAPKLIRATRSDNEEFQLTGQEVRLIRNYRAMEHVAQETFVDISEEFALSLPAPRRIDLSATVSVG
jgi:hypothetical protein